MYYESKTFQHNRFQLPERTPIIRWVSTAKRLLHLPPVAVVMTMMIIPGIPLASSLPFASHSSFSRCFFNSPFLMKKEFHAIYIRRGQNKLLKCFGLTCGKLGLYLTFFCSITYSDLLHCFVFNTVCVTHHQAECVTRETSSSCLPRCVGFSSCSKESTAGSSVD
jgi:hypothetical protein